MPAQIKYIDLFCGIGGFRLAIENAGFKYGIGTQCVFSSEIDTECRKAYEANFGENPFGDISKIESRDIPRHDILLAGFPCQSFSIIGNGKGFDDVRGTLFFEIARILEAKKPSAFVLENVKQLASNNKRSTLSKIIEVLNEIGYFTDFAVLNALHFGLPQKRERIFIVGFSKSTPYLWPQGGVHMKPLKEILEKNPPKEYYASDYIRLKRHSMKKPTKEPTIWHENKSGNVGIHNYSCALRAGASHNYLLVNGERRLTPREMLRLQGFPDSFKIVCNYANTRKQAGNSLPVPVAEAVISQVFYSIGLPENSSLNGATFEEDAKTANC